MLTASPGLIDSFLYPVGDLLKVAFGELAAFAFQFFCSILFKIINPVEFFENLLKLLKNFHSLLQRAFARKPFVLILLYNVVAFL